MEQHGRLMETVSGLRYSRIAGTGRYLPERILTNADLERMVDTTDEWIRTRTGMERRHLAADEQASSDLAIPAARAALQAANCRPQDIDLVVVGTTTPDLVFPNVGCMVQDALGIPPCGAFSCEAACTGWLYALSIADGMIRLGRANKALVVGVEVLSRITDWNDRGTCVLFGDGAGAVVLEPATEPGMMSFILGADGSYVDILRSRSGVSRNPGQFSDGGAAVRMKGSEVFKIAVRTMGGTVDQLLERHGLARGDIDWLIPHQANIRIIQAIGKRLGLPGERVILTVQDHGNTGAASIPLALDVAVRDGRIRRGQRIMMVSFGGGLTWAAGLMQF
ncbi:beta-ketoacyl-ACP synthase III [Candidatus Foliamicus sp.]